MRENRIDLSHLHADVDARVDAIRAQHVDWLCCKGCADCCRKLADVPRLAAAEWELLREGLAALPADRLDEIGGAVAALAGRQPGPLACPMLDTTTGSCPVYRQRPVACRTYGFYVQRELGLYCKDIESRVGDGSLADVVWGNHDAIDQRLGALGDSRLLTEWFEEWPSGA